MPACAPLGLRAQFIQLNNNSQWAFHARVSASEDTGPFTGAQGSELARTGPTRGAPRGRWGRTRCRGTGPMPERGPALHHCKESGELGRTTNPSDADPGITRTSRRAQSHSRAGRTVEGCARGARRSSPSFSLSGHKRPLVSKIFRPLGRHLVQWQKALERYKREKYNLLHLESVYPGGEKIKIPEGSNFFDDVSIFCLPKPQF